MLLKSLLKHSLIKFLSVGVVNTLLCIAVIFGLKFFFNTQDVLANIIGYVIGLSCSFVLNKRWTFKHSADTLSTAPKFLLVFAIAYLFNIAIVLGLIKLGLNAYLAHLAGMPIYTVLFYIGSRYYVFTPSRNQL